MDLEEKRSPKLCSRSQNDASLELPSDHILHIGEKKKSYLGKDYSCSETRRDERKEETNRRQQE